MHPQNKYGLPIDGISQQQLKHNAHWFLGLGIGLILLGTVALIFSYWTTLFSVMYFGAFMVIVGIFEGIKSYKMHRWSTFFLHLFLSILYIVGGSFIVWYPTINALSLTLLLSLFFIISGILKIIFVATCQTPHRFWLFANGIITLLLGILILKEWPLSGLWVIGMLLGIETIFTGWTYVMLATIAQKIDTSH
jgi:uncharacterized membrane protein HdeD (DUF308 family)